MAKRSEAAKFSESAQLFKFCHRILSDQQGSRINDQDVGNILDYNPSDCSHWKRGEKQVKSVFAFEKLAKALHVDVAILQDLGTGVANLDEAYFEHLEISNMRDAWKRAAASGQNALTGARQRIEKLFSETLDRSQQAPVYIPEILRFFPFVQLQPADMIDRVSRVLRTKPGQYTIQHTRSQMRSQTRMSIVKDLARIVLDGERARFASLGLSDPETSQLEQAFFVVNLLIPKKPLLQEMSKIDIKKNYVNELSALFWVPRSLMNFQLRDLVLNHQVVQPNAKVIAQSNAELPGAA